MYWHGLTSTSARHHLEAKNHNYRLASRTSWHLLVRRWAQLYISTRSKLSHVFIQHSRQYLQPQTKAGTAHTPPLPKELLHGMVYIKGQNSGPYSDMADRLFKRGGERKEISCRHLNRSHFQKRSSPTISRCHFWLRTPFPPHSEWGAGFDTSLVKLRISKKTACQTVKRSVLKEFLQSLNTGAN